MASTTASPAQISMDAIHELKASLSASADVLTPDSEGYAESIQRWSESAERRAAIVVLPTSASDISTTMHFIRTHSLPFTVRGGGHASSGASSSEGGLVIDLSRMRRVVVDPTARLIHVQGGARWCDVDQAAGEHGLATVGGTVNDTGVGGLTLGGGYGWLSGQYGLAIDNLVAVEMVLADGRVVKASDDEHPDLFWAVRGAGSSFGVAVEFTFRAHVMDHPVWGGLMIFPAHALEDVVKFANHLVEVSKGESGMMVALTFSPAPPPPPPPSASAAPAPAPAPAPAATPPPSPPSPPVLVPTVIAVCFYDGPQDTAEAFFEPLARLQPVVNTTHAMPYAELNGMINVAATPGGRKITKGSKFAPPISPSLVRSLLDELVRFRSSIVKTTTTPTTATTTHSPKLIFEFYHQDAICAVPLHATAFASRGPQQNVMIGPEWSDPADDATCRAWARRIAEEYFSVDGCRKKHALHAQQEEEEAPPNPPPPPTSAYGNYDNLSADLGPHEASALFGTGPLLDRLCRVKTSYDPENRFAKVGGLGPVCVA